MSIEPLTPSLNIPEGWDWNELGSLVDPMRGISYGIVQPGTHDPDGVPIVRVNNIKNGRIDLVDALRVSPDVEIKYQRTRLRGGELLLSLVGTLGECAIVPPSMRDWNVARAVAVIPVAPNVDPRWIAYCLKSASTQRAMREWATTTVQATLNLKDVRRLPILLAPHPIRGAITELLGSLDGKIEHNRRTAQTLERLARAIFKAWFVDFEPVKAKAAGAASFPSMPQEVFDSLPTRFVEREIGLVPEGWEVKPVSKIATFLNGLALQKYPARADGNDLPVIKIAQLRKGSTDGADSANADVPTDYIIDDNDLLFSWSGTLEVELWFGGRGALNQHLFKVTSERFPKWFCLLWIRQHLPWFRTIASSKATTMGHIKRGHLDEAKAVIPSKQILEAADSLLGPLYAKFSQVQVESRKLAQMRDLLLPELLSGRTRVREGEGDGDGE